jgi:hypothetical protein
VIESVEIGRDLSGLLVPRSGRLVATAAATTAETV